LPPTESDIYESAQSPHTSAFRLTDPAFGESPPIPALQVTSDPEIHQQRTRE
jgi:hypothetical protein